jgi:hypothetical protein
MVTIVESIAGALERANVVALLDDSIGDRTQARRALGVVVGPVVGAVAHHANDSAGCSALWSIVAEDVGGLMSSPERDDQLARLVFGSARATLERRLVHQTGLDEQSVSSLLSTTLTAYLDHLRRQVVLEKLDLDGLRRAVTTDRAEAAGQAQLTSLYTAIAPPVEEFPWAIRLLTRSAT